jgi:glycosyltransferase involved in cell wall biosynthesis
LVIDDGSTDGTAARVRDFPEVELIQQKNGGPGAARNSGVRHARGPWIAFLDADDLWHPEKLARQVACLKGSKVGLVFTGMQVARLQPSQAYALESKVQPGLHASTMLAHQNSFSRLGPFSEDRRLGEFIEWLARAEEAGLPYQVVPEPLVTRRIHTTNLGIRARDRRQDYVYLVRQIQLRRRAAAVGETRKGKEKP